MKRLSKAALAGTLAVALLVGGAGTFARWYDQQDVATSTISTGQLSLVAGEGTWLINTADGNDADEDPSVPFDPSVDKIVPGDIIFYNVQVTPTLEGKNIQAVLSADLSETGIADLVSTTGELNRIQVSTETTDSSGGSISNPLTPADSGKQYNLTVKIVFPEYTDTVEASSGTPQSDRSNFWHNEFQQKEIDLSALAIKADLVQKNR